MSNFETDNQDKRNMVGPEEVMDKAVNVEQERLSLIDEVRELKEQVEMLKGMVGILEVPDDDSKEWQSMKEKAKAWDNLEALVAGNTCYVEIGNNSLSVERFYVDDPYIRYEDVTDLKEAVSSAIESIRGES